MPYLVHRGHFTEQNARQVVFVATALMCYPGDKCTVGQNRILNVLVKHHYFPCCRVCSTHLAINAVHARQLFGYHALIRCPIHPCRTP